jgi:hypothetical protein
MWSTWAALYNHLEKVKAASIEFVLLAFYECGIDMLALDVVLAGGQALDFCGSGGCRHLCGVITGT